jgi:hypothetical protein
VEWINVEHDKDRWSAAVNTVMIAVLILNHHHHHHQHIAIMELVHLLTRSGLNFKMDLKC